MVRSKLDAVCELWKLKRTLMLMLLLLYGGMLLGTVIAFAVHQAGAWSMIIAMIFWVLGGLVWVCDVPESLGTGKTTPTFLFGMLIVLEYCTTAYAVLGISTAM